MTGEDQHPDREAGDAGTPDRATRHQPASLTTQRTPPAPMTALSTGLNGAPPPARRTYGTRVRK
jgi:hypothetical protein